ncbi:MAG: FecR family protein [Nitrospinota bacterium]|nr:FecR family protein [Nitrospinota bacterium]
MMNTHRIAKLVSGFLLCGVLAVGVTGAQAANNVGDLSLALAKGQGIPATDAQGAWKALQGKKWIPEEVFFTDPVSANVAQVIAIGMIHSGQKARQVAIALTAAASIAAVPLKEAVQGIVAAAIAAGVDINTAAKAASEGAVKGAAAQVAEVKTKGEYIERLFLNKSTRRTAVAAYIPKGKADYAGVVKQLAAKGEKVLVGSKPDDPLTREEFIVLSYLLDGGKPGTSLGEKKLFLKKKGVVRPEDIGLIKSFQGDVTLAHKGAKEGKAVTGNEAILFKDIGETELDAKMELLFDDGSTLTISEDTALTIDEMVYDPKTKFRSIKLRVKAGTIRVRTARNDNPKSKFSILTPTVVAGLRGTDVYMSVTPAGVSNMISNTGANAGNVVMRGVTRADSPPAPATPPPGPPPVLPATPAEAPPAITVTPGNASSAAVGQAAPAPPAPPAPAAVAAATTATNITNPTPPQAISVSGAAAGPAATAAANGAVAAAQAAGVSVGEVAAAASAGAVTAAAAAGADVATVATATANGAVAAAQAAGADVATVASFVSNGAMTAAQAVGANVAAVASGAGNGAMLAAQAAGGNVAAVATATSQGAVAWAQASGANVAAIAHAASLGSLQGAQVSGANTGNVAQAATSGAIAAAAAGGGNIAVVANATAQAVVSGTQGMGGNAGVAAQAASSGALQAAAIAGANIAAIATAMARGCVTAAQAEGANVGAIAQAASAGAIQAAAAFGGPGFVGPAGPGFVGPGGPGFVDPGGPGFVDPGGPGFVSPGGPGEPPPAFAAVIARAMAQGAMAAAQASGADIGAVAHGTASGSIAAAHAAGVNVGGVARSMAQAMTQSVDAASMGIVAQSASSGAVQAAAVSGANMNAVVQAASGGAIRGAAAAGGVNIAVIVQAASAGAVSGAAVVQQAIVRGGPISSILGGPIPGILAGPAGPGFVGPAGPGFVDPGGPGFVGPGGPGSPGPRVVGPAIPPVDVGAIANIVTMGAHQHVQAVVATGRVLGGGPGGQGGPSVFAPAPTGVYVSGPGGPGVVDPGGPKVVGPAGPGEPGVVGPAGPGSPGPRVVGPAIPATTTTHHQLSANDIDNAFINAVTAGGTVAQINALLGSQDAGNILDPAVVEAAILQGVDPSLISTIIENIVDVGDVQGFIDSGNTDAGQFLTDEAAATDETAAALVAAGTSGNAPVVVKTSTGKEIFNVLLETETDGSLSIFTFIRVEDPDGVVTLGVDVKIPNRTNPIGLSIAGSNHTSLTQPELNDTLVKNTFERSLTASLLGIEIPSTGISGDYIFRIEDPDTGTITRTKNFAGVSGALPAISHKPNISGTTTTPTLSISAVSDAVGYMFIATTSGDPVRQILFDGVSGPNLSSSPHITVPAGILQSGTQYTFQVEAFDAITEEGATRISTSAVSSPYTP